MRRTLLLTVALLTFLLGTTLAMIRNTLAEIAEVKEVSVPPFDTRESLTPLRIGIFIGVDGATLSADDKKFAFFESYEDRETLVGMSPAQLSDIVNQLRSAGLFEEAEFNTPFFVSLPQTYAIIIAWPDGYRRFIWITRDDCKVPEKYLQIFERFNRDLKLHVIQDFIAHNRR
ncbi:MAG TPA: hypothetical protein VJR02_10930 [Pyrinomonadaceae bacterium]|nr:hypothetical protein [Pyrinomonadaceae bacterium]